MGFRVMYREPQECTCDMPRKGGWNRDDVLQCDQCESFWRCTGWSPRDPYKPGDEYLLWEKVRKLHNERENRIVWEPFDTGLLK
jgi:hypothetical protein